jgi:hypothetical protein
MCAARSRVAAAASSGGARQRLKPRVDCWRVPQPGAGGAADRPATGRRERHAGGTPRGADGSGVDRHASEPGPHFAPDILSRCSGLDADLAESLQVRS